MNALVVVDAPGCWLISKETRGAGRDGCLCDGVELNLSPTGPLTWVFDLSGLQSSLHP